MVKKVVRRTSKPKSVVKPVAKPVVVVTEKQVLDKLDELFSLDEEINLDEIDEVTDTDVKEVLNNIDTTITSLPTYSSSMSVNNSKQSHIEDTVLDVVNKIITDYSIDEPLDDVLHKFNYFLQSRNINFNALTTHNITTFVKVMKHYNLILIKYELGF